MPGPVKVKYGARPRAATLGLDRRPLRAVADDAEMHVLPAHRPRIRWSAASTRRSRPSCWPITPT